MYFLLGNIAIDYIRNCNKTRDVLNLPIQRCRSSAACLAKMLIEPVISCENDAGEKRRVHYDEILMACRSKMQRR